MTTEQDKSTPPRTPGQAEGTRDEAEQSSPSAPASTPGTAEGDRETVEADLKEKGLDR